MEEQEITAEEAITMIANGAKAMGWSLAMADTGEDNLQYLIVGEDEVVSAILQKLEE